MLDLWESPPARGAQPCKGHVPGVRLQQQGKDVPLQRGFRLGPRAISTLALVGLPTPKPGYF
ncbi:MAG TPA: hypothetical protein VN648_17445 [Candidatus Methylomirabilis sp.]|nr:hypothetical protein [Candidatus Methylomirabilis sp.]